MSGTVWCAAADCDRARAAPLPVGRIRRTGPHRRRGHAVTAALDFWADRPERADLRMVDAVWHRFERAADRMRRGLDGTAPHFDPERILASVLGELSDRLAGSFERDGAGWRVVLSPLRQSDRLIARAAQRRFPDLPGWSAGDARAPVPPGDVLPAGVRSGAQTILPRRGPHRLVDIEVAGQGGADALEAEATWIAHALLGEARARDWLGETRGRPARRGLLRRLLPPRPLERRLSRVQRAIEAAIRQMEGQRPDTPFARVPSEGARLTAYRPPTSADPGRPRADCTLWMSRHPALVAARIAGAPVAPVRFTRFAESFVALQIRRGSAGPFARPDALERLARAVEAHLMEAGLGAVTGQGEGARHIYLDLALLELAPALPALAALLRAEGIEVPVWMIFDEAGLEHLTLPLFPGTPPRPF